MLVGMRNSRCCLSRDAGRTWTECNGPEGLVIGFHFDNTRQGRTLFTATAKGIWRSDDSGKTWADKTVGLPTTDIQGFTGGSNKASSQVILYCTIPSRMEDGALTGGVYCSLDRGTAWQSAMGAGINMDTKTADQWAFGPISQYTHILTTDANPRTVYVTNTSTGFHPPHHETVYRSDNGGQTWRATYFQDPRFKDYNVAPNYVTASAGQSYKGGDTPFDTAICWTIR